MSTMMTIDDTKQHLKFIYKYRNDKALTKLLMSNVEKHMALTGESILLMCIAQVGDIENMPKTIQVLIDAGADSNKSNRYGVTPLGKAISLYKDKKERPDFDQSVEVSLELKAIVKVLLPFANDKTLWNTADNSRSGFGSGGSLVFFCVKTENIDVLNLLLEGGAALFMDRKKYNGECVQMACRNGDADILALLIRYGAKDFTTKDRDGKTCMSIAAAGNHIDCIKILVEAQSDDSGNNGTKKRAHDITPPLAPKKFKKSGQCSICLDRDSVTVFVDCGHCCCCATCSKTVSLCPICRKSITKRIDPIFS